MSQINRSYLGIDSLWQKSPASLPMPQTHIIYIDFFLFFFLSISLSIYLPLSLSLPYAGRNHLFICPYLYPPTLYSYFSLLPLSLPSTLTQTLGRLRFVAARGPAPVHRQLLPRRQRDRRDPLPGRRRVPQHRDVGTHRLRRRKGPGPAGPAVMQAMHSRSQVPHHRPDVAHGLRRWLLPGPNGTVGLQNVYIW